MNGDPTNRFSGRADYYAKYRPSYPLEIIEELENRLGLTKENKIAEIASGTGKLTEILLKKGFNVYGVEPNDDMRNVAENLLKGFKNFSSVKGRAEKTNLDEKSVDFIVIAQAIHWFERKSSLKEFKRILKPEGHIAIIWNQRDIEGSPLQKEYDEILLEFSPAYRKMPHRNLSNLEMAEYIGSNSIKEFRSNYSQFLSFADIKGRLDSTSYVPKQNDPIYSKLMDKIKILFEEYQKDGIIEYPYITRMFYGKLKKI